MNRHAPEYHSGNAMSATHRAPNTMLRTATTLRRASKPGLHPIRDAVRLKLSGRYPEAVLKLSANRGRSWPGQLADRVGGDSLTRVPPPRLAAPTFGGLGMASPAYLVKLSARTASCLPRASRRSPIDE
jgi:hypothetical protein